ncbi:MAG: PHP domain-containing protein [Bacillota bacterium]|nr:MAG: PHP domain-containing protein [Bacillota bacterium]
MRFYYDLHIHTVLSPCADVLMTPHNIFNMAMLKKIDIIAITDHNSCKQLSMCEEISKSYDMLFIPGVEISLSEGFHVLCYFKTVKDAMAFDKILETYIKHEDVDLDLYNEQAITNEYDETIQTYPYLLSSDTDLSFEELIKILKNFDAILGYAHLDRSKHSGLHQVHEKPLNFVEITSHASDAFIEQNLLDRYPIFINSDAHQITSISERKYNYIDLKELNIDAFFRYFHHG